MSFRRYKLLKLLLPVFLLIYLSMVGARLLSAVPHAETFPFFSWLLFAHTPGWQRTAHAVIVHSINGVPVAGTRYLVPGPNIRDDKTLRAVVLECRRPANCDAAVAQSLYPVVRKRAGANDVEFSIVAIVIDLRHVQSNIRQLANGNARRSDLYQLTDIVGRWSTVSGRIPPDIPASARPLAHAHFDLYPNGNALIYAKSPCRPADTPARFLLQIFPANSNDLPPHRKGYGFDRPDFNFNDFDRQSAPKCVTVRKLPEYAISSVRTGPYGPGAGIMWETRFPLPRRPIAAPTPP